jgi:predicted RNA binding protein YcfA (HicA-like mRNA interferase family)
MTINNSFSYDGRWDTTDRKSKSIYTQAWRVYHTHMSSADLLSELKKAGWRLARVNGSHHVFTHPQHTGIVVVPHPKKDLGKGLVKAIRQQAGI